MEGSLILEGLPMWTSENRAQYNRDKLRYPSDLTDAECRQGAVRCHRRHDAQDRDERGLPGDGLGYRRSRRAEEKKPPSEGGWNMFHTWSAGVDCVNLAPQPAY